MADKIKCPDCGEELDEVLVERYVYKTFKIDYENKVIVPVYKDAAWEEDNGDEARRCPHCDSLNVDEVFVQFETADDHGIK